MSKRISGISQLMMFSLLLMTLISVLLSGLIWVFVETTRNLREKEHVRNSYLESQKAYLQREVNDVLDDISFRRSRMTQRLSENLQEQLNEGEHLMQGMRNSGASFPIILSALRNSHPGSGKCQYLVMRTNGVVLVNPGSSQLEGSNLLSLGNRVHRYIYREIIDSTRTQSTTVLNYTWPKPDDPLTEHTRIVCARYLPQFGVILGVMEFVEDEEAEIQRDALAKLGSLHFGNDGYFFAYDFEGNCLSHYDRTLVGKNDWNRTDARGVKVVQSFINLAQQSTGGFLTYISAVKPSTRKPAQKVAFVKSIPDWHWVIGAGVYLDDVDAQVNARHAQLKLLVRQHIQLTLLVLAVCLWLSLMLARIFARHVSREIDVFSDSFVRTLRESKTIDTSQLRFKEFEHLAETSNRLIEDQQRTARALAESETRFRAIIEAAKDAVFIKDVKQNYTFVNPSMGAIFGIKSSDFIGRKYDQVVVGENLDSIAHDDSKVLQGQVIENEYTLRLPNRIIVLHAIKVPLYDPEGNIFGICGIARDLTEHKRSEAALRQAQKMESIGTLASGIAHDFNNILSAILGYTELATFRAGKNTEIMGNLNEILKACNRAKDLVKQILAFSSRKEEEAKPIQFSLIVKDAMKMMRASLPSTIQITMDIGSTSKVKADPTQLHQIVVNLCTNAFHAMKAQGGNLWITLKDWKYEDLPTEARFHLKDTNYIALTVKDTGHGIPPEIIHKIFEPYFTSKPADEGTGLGLAIVQRIIDNYEGRIEVVSEVGVGTMFTIYLPVVEDNSAPEERVETANLQITPSHILFVDDETSIVDIVSKNLSFFGYQVTPCNSSPEAFDIFSANPDKFDLLITDMTMPKMTGLDLSRAILDIRTDLPVILITGFSNNLTPETMQECGINELIYKPFDIQALIFLIEKLRKSAIISSRT